MLVERESARENSHALALNWRGRCLGPAPKGARCAYYVILYVPLSVQCMWTSATQRVSG